MSPFVTARSPTASARRWLALALCTAALSAPLAASAQPSATTRHAAYERGGETVEQRISNMHAALRITPSEEADWTKVAEVMHRNDREMEKMVAEREARVPHELNAVEDLKTYERFTQAHVDGLKDLISSFETLYAEMPQDQKTIADHVFARFGHERVQGRHASRSNS